ncbi:helix-turn-helix domain-containing protein [Micromonospora sp. RV43]|uniref:helix-turn-helix domain-containing protein n=1 Tax=Micromonospora sp. RV43 TaxID=1661387 RepID=UPI00064BA6F4|nr:helix-turn-helix transcriptional regulator [Micromonospora sp. RV43]
MLLKAARQPRHPLHHDPAAVRQARIARNLSQAELAKAIGLRSVGHISEIEGGTRNAGPDLLRSIAEALNCGVAALERQKKHQCERCGYGYDEAPNGKVPLHTVLDTDQWCPKGGETRSAA